MYLTGESRERSKGLDTRVSNFENAVLQTTYIFLTKFVFGKTGPVWSRDLVKVLARYVSEVNK